MSERGVANLLAPVGRGLQIHWRVLVRQLEGGPAAQTFLVKVESRFALAVERQIWIQLHRGSLNPAYFRSVSFTFTDSFCSPRSTSTTTSSPGLCDRSAYVKS